MWQDHVGVHEAEVKEEVRPISMTGGKPKLSLSREPGDTPIAEQFCQSTAPALCPSHNLGSSCGCELEPTLELPISGMVPVGRLPSGGRATEGGLAFRSWDHIGATPTLVCY